MLREILFQECVTVRAQYIAHHAWIDSPAGWADRYGPADARAAYPTFEVWRMDISPSLVGGLLVLAKMVGVG